MSNKLQNQYKKIVREDFPAKMEITFEDECGRHTFFYEKTEWVIGGERRGLRYGENPGQPAAMYRLINGNLRIAEVETLQAGRWLASDVELLQSGKHPGKINITDVDSALNILRYFQNEPCAVIIKHNNPCGAAKGGTLHEAFQKAFYADRLAAFGGAVAVNREVDRETALAIAQNYAEVIAAPEYGEGVMEIFGKKKNLRVMRIRNMEKLGDWAGKIFLDYRSLIDGGIIVQTSYNPLARAKEDLLPAQTEYQGKTYAVTREPTPAEYEDMIFGWLVESGITSNSVIYVRDGATVGIGTGEQDRVGVAGIARDKAYRKLADRLSWERSGKLFADAQAGDREEILTEVKRLRGGLPGCVMISDGFFPFRDGIDVGLREGVSAVLQPGGSLRDFESIEACNEYGAAMKFTGQRSFRH
ncbi:MAG: IMP cyclohydrolase [Spirochaetales bacterium]|jgi:phosphoribosylaminoimidazolecarboxamide formyltransferase/IMP cyclohydrolase|nr:IMP cyclohydrolase [Spirochaetales bacterium]